MAATKNEEGQQKKKRPQVEQDFRDFRSGTAQAADVFKNLEGLFFAESEKAKEIHMPADVFLLKYILTVVLDCHLKETDQDILLAVFGFLPGYEGLGVQDRQREYCKWVGIHAKGVDKPLDVHWLPENFFRQMNAKENAAIKRLYNSVRAKMEQNGGVLGYIKDQKKIDEISNKVSPQPFYLSEKGYRKCEHEGRVFYVPLTEKEKRILAFQAEQRSQPVEIDGEGMGSDKPIVDNPPVPNPPPEPAPEPEPEPPPPDSEPDPPPPDPPPPKPKLSVFLKTILPVCIVLAFVAIFGIFWLWKLTNPASPNGSPEPNQNEDEVNLTELRKKVSDEDMAELILDAQASIATYNESGDYDTDSMLALVRKRIVDNPIYGDMVAQGLVEANIIGGGGLLENNLWLSEFIEQTDTTMDNINSNQMGMQRWLIRWHDTISATDEYREYADKLCAVLDFFVVGDVLNLNGTCQWTLAADASGIYARATKDTDQSTQTALILVFQQADGAIRYMIGFSIADGSVVVSDPWKLGLEAFTD